MSFTRVYDGSVPLRDLRMLTATVGWAVGDGGLLLRTLDGTSWEALSSGTANDILAVEFVNLGHGFFVDGTQAREGTQGGEQWSTPAWGSLPGYGYLDVTFVDPDHGFVAVRDSGGGPAVLRTVDAGESVTEHVLDGACLGGGDITRLRFGSSLQGAAVGATGILVTGDGGETWICRNALLPGADSDGVAALDWADEGRLVVYVGGATDVLYLSDDGGASFEEVSVAASRVGISLKAIAANSLTDVGVVGATPSGTRIALEGGETLGATGWMPRTWRASVPSG